MPPKKTTTAKPPAKPKAEPKPKYVSRVYTDDEQRAMLRSFVEIPEDRWGEISSGDFIRYVDTDGKFRSGGMVDIVYGDTGKMMIRSGRTAWGIDTANIQTIYVRMGLATVMLREQLETTIRTLDSNIRKIAEELQRLRRELRN